MREFIKSFVDSYSERIKNPFLGSFSISFLLFNWRPLLILLFSDFAIEEKISIIDTYYCNLSAILWPIGLGIFYVLILPYFNLMIEKLLGLAKNERYKIKNKIIDENLSIRKKQATNERDIADIKAGTSQINELKSQIDNLTIEKNDKSETITTLRELHNTEINNLREQNTILTNRIDELLNKNIDVENKYSENSKVLKLLTSFDSENEINIKKYLRENLSNNEIKALKRVRNELSSVNTEHITKTILALLLKGYICDISQNSDIVVIDFPFVQSL
ncbi:hypothetical protein ACI6PS_11940 [Flavobacterium sp. PLA-1-15]|uniref:hypothetical protein n=1 Tax=Flavobacterium sp. PLA-1-15 TaxID=3380533 RepID=UPI003B79A331